MAPVLGEAASGPQLTQRTGERGDLLPPPPGFTSQPLAPCGKPKPPPPQPLGTCGHWGGKSPRESTGAARPLCGRTWTAPAPWGPAGAGPLLSHSPPGREGCPWGGGALAWCIPSTEAGNRCSEGWFCGAGGGKKSQPPSGCWSEPAAHWGEPAAHGASTLPGPQRESEPGMAEGQPLLPEEAGRWFAVTRAQKCRWEVALLGLERKPPVLEAADRPLREPMCRLRMCLAAAAPREAHRQPPAPSAPRHTRGPGAMGSRERAGARHPPCTHSHHCTQIPLETQGVNGTCSNPCSQEQGCAVPGRHVRVPAWPRIGGV